MAKLCHLWILLSLFLPIIYSSGESTVFVKSPPIIHDISILPETPHDDDFLTCNFEVFDNFPYTAYSYWRAPDNRTFQTNKLNPDFTSAGENWTCVIYAEGKYGISSESISVTIKENENSVITGSFIDPADGKEPSTSIFYKLYLLILNII